MVIAAHPPDRTEFPEPKVQLGRFARIRPVIDVRPGCRKSHYLPKKGQLNHNDERHLSRLFNNVALVQRSLKVERTRLTKANDNLHKE